MKIQLVAYVLLAVLLIVCAEKALFEEFKFQDFISGDWSIEKTTTVFKKGGDAPEKTTITAHLNFTTNAIQEDQLGETQTLVATLSQAKNAPVDPLLDSEEEETEEEAEEEIKFEITDATSGTVAVNKKDSFELNFAPLQRNAVGSVTPQCKLFFTNKNHFILVLTSVSEDGTVVEQVYSGERIVAQSQASFFQKYGPSLMIGLFIFGSKLFQRQAPQAPAAAAQ